MKTEFKKTVAVLTVAIGVWTGITPAAQAAPAGPVTARVCNAVGACKPIPTPLAAALLAAPIVIGNVQASGRESGLPAQVLRVTLGISARDIQKDGFWGGECSVFRRPLGC